MTKVFCDSCMASIEGQQVKDWTFEIALPNRANPHEGPFKFTGDLMLGVWKFNSSDKAFCSRCILEALKAGAATLTVKKGGAS